MSGTNPLWGAPAPQCKVVGASPGPSPLLSVEPFTLAELQRSMFKMRCGRGAGGDGLVLELFKYGPPCLHACLACFDNFDLTLRLHACRQPI